MAVRREVERRLVAEVVFVGQLVGRGAVVYAHEDYTSLVDVEIDVVVFEMRAETLDVFGVNSKVLSQECEVSFDSSPVLFHETGNDFVSVLHNQIVNL